MYQLQRLIEIDLLVRAGKSPTPDQLAEHFGVSRRQIFLDRKRLIEDLGAPLKNDRKKGGWVYSNPTWVLPTTVMNEDEILALFLAVRVAQESAPDFSGELQNALDKLKRSLGELKSSALHALDQTTFAASPVAPVENQKRLQLNQAREERRKMRLHYRTGSSGELKVRVVHPYHVHYARGEWIMFAHDELRGELRTFNIARIQSLQPLEQHFQIPPTFDARKLLDSMLWAETGAQTFDIALRFDAYQARFIRERTYHSAQQLEELPEGELILRFPASGLAEVARFALGFGAHAQVLAPPELREIVASHLDQLKAIYKEKTDE